jgi:polysaccharide pyruvyl transferase WcaK-like protein
MTVASDDLGPRTVPAREWPPGRPRILATDAWLANAGDAAITVALERMLRELAPTASVLHASYQYERIGPRLPELRFVPPLEDLLGTPWAGPASGWDGAGAALVDGADLVVCQGGGFLLEAYEPRARLATLAEVVRREKPLALVGVTVSRFDRAPNRADLHTVFAGAELIVVRDPSSAVHVADCGATDIVLGTDLALALFPQPPRDRARHGIGVVVTDHHTDAASRPQRREVATHVVGAAVDAAEGQPVTVWSTVQGEADVAREDDSRVAAAAIAALPEPARATVRAETGYVTPMAAIEAAAGCTALVTMRMHPALFAAASGTPFALVLGGQRTGVFAGSRLSRRIVEPEAGPALTTAIRDTISGATNTDTWGALAPLRERLGETRRRLAEFLGAAGTRW